MVKGICVVCPYLKDLKGHFFGYVNSIYRVAQSRGMNFRVVASQDVTSEVSQQLPTVNAFRPDREKGLWTWPILRTWRKHLDYSAGIDETKAVATDSTWVVFVETVNQLQLLSWARKLGQYTGSQQTPTVMFMLRSDLLGQWGGLPKPSAYRYAFSKLEKLASRVSVRLVSDSALLCAEYQKLTTIPVHLLPIPHTVPEQPFVEPLRGAPIHFVSPGLARKRKGFDTLALAIELLANRKQLEGCRFSLQCYQLSASSLPASVPSGATHGEPSVDDSIRSLRELGHPAVRLIEQSLDEDAYYALLGAADVVLIPYSAECYRLVTSGPFTEALSLGKPVVVTEGTWMSAQIPEFGAGVVCKDGDPEDIARAILAVRDHYASLAADARARARLWTSYHNPETFVDTLVRIVDVE